MTPEEKQKRIAELEARLAQLEAPAVEEEPGLVEKTIRGLNLAGGAVRGAIAGAAEPFVGKDIVSLEEVKSGTVPGAAELMERAGVPAGASLSEMIENRAKVNPLFKIPEMMYSETGEGLPLQKGGMFDPTARGIGGLAADILLDPTTYLAAPLKAAQLAKAGTTAGKALKIGEILLNPMGEAVGAIGAGTKKGGKEFYKSAFEKADRELSTRYGKGSIADLLKSEGFKGSAEEALTKTQEINEKAGKAISSFREQADLEGALEKPIDFKKAEEFVLKFRSSPDPKKAAIADNLQETLDAYRAMPAKTATELADIKQMLRKDFGGDSFMDQLRIAQNPEQAELASKIYPQIAKAEDEAVKKALPTEAFDQYIKAKKDYGITTKFAQKELAKLGRAEMTRTGVMPSAVDIMGMGMAGAAGSPIGMGAMATKKARDIMRLTGTKTRLGPMVEAAGGGIEATAAKIPPQVWLEMLRSKPEGEQR